MNQAYSFIATDSYVVNKPQAYMMGAFLLHNLSTIKLANFTGNFCL